MRIFPLVLGVIIVGTPSVANASPTVNIVGEPTTVAVGQPVTFTAQVGSTDGAPATITVTATTPGFTLTSVTSPAATGSTTGSTWAGTAPNGVATLTITEVPTATTVSTTATSKSKSKSTPKAPTTIVPFAINVTAGENAYQQSIPAKVAPVSVAYAAPKFALGFTKNPFEKAGLSEVYAAKILDGTANLSHDWCKDVSVRVKRFQLTSGKHWQSGGRLIQTYDRTPAYDAKRGCTFTSQQGLVPYPTSFRGIDLRFEFTISANKPLPLVTGKKGKPTPVTVKELFRIG